MKKISAFSFLAFQLLVCTAAPLFYLRAPRSPDETNHTVDRYRASWQYTNTTATNVWTAFATWPAWTNSHATNLATNLAVIPVPDEVPSLTWLSFQALGTNGVLSARSASLLYNTNALWPLITNQITPPRVPATGFLTNN